MGKKYHSGNVSKGVANGSNTYSFKHLSIHETLAIQTLKFGLKFILTKKITKKKLTNTPEILPWF